MAAAVSSLCSKLSEAAAEGRGGAFTNDEVLNNLSALNALPRSVNFQQRAICVVLKAAVVSGGEW